MKRLMVPFFCLVLLASMVPFNVAPLAAAEPQLTQIASYEPPPPPTIEELWQGFWQKLNKYADWNLEWYNGAQWVSVKEDMRIVRDYPLPNVAKLTLVFDASHAGNYRLTFAIDQKVKQYISYAGENAYQLDYDNMSLVFDWNDALAIPGIVFTHGVLNDMFWFRMRRDNVPLGAHVEIDPQIVATYDFSNNDGSLSITALHPSATTSPSSYGMSFQTPGAPNTLYAVDFELRLNALPTGNATVQIFAHSGVFGTSSLPTGAALATSEFIDVSTLPSGSVAPVRAFFTGANQINLAATTYYCVAFINPAAGTIDATNRVHIGSDSSPGAAGNAFRYLSSAWAVLTIRDIGFNIWGIGAPTIVDVTPTTAFSLGEYGWINVTVQEDKGIANLSRVDLYVNTTGAAQNFSLRWTQATDVFSEESDTSAIVELSGSVREDVNATATKLAFRFRFGGTPTEGDCDARVYVLNDDALDNTVDYPALFSYVGIEWDPIGDLINAAFSLFGISNYMTNALNFVGNIGGQFVGSITNLAILINLQFQVIWAVFAWWLGWAERIITMVLTFGATLQGVLNGTLTGASNIWAFFELATWIDGLTLFIIIYWIDSMVKRSDTQGSLGVLMNDLQVFANVFSFFMTAFANVIGFIEGKISWLFQALT